ncbi:hypothetical protein [Streptomyces sp. NBC_01800]|uniref:hypothetical protein n=1 Tax=Streptomyces sp. NBC_01800 TaxID=2975945 RepID=UPI002DDBED1F|nr:hypothetical protein [Streptomyces sp. NBC_01800]WSA68832.1 DUF3846 domain-containing protein [Streptomyces sp. NBC_01800]
MTTPIRGIRLDVDGTLTDLELPVAEGLSAALRPVVGGWVEIAHYARPGNTHRLSVAVNEEGVALELPQNHYATALVSAIRLKQLGYCLLGPVVLLGALDGAGLHTDVPEVLRDGLPQIIDALKPRYTPATS